MDNATISTGNDPFPRTPNERAKQQTLDRVGFAIAFAVMFGLAPLASSFAVPIVKEVQSKVSSRVGRRKNKVELMHRHHQYTNTNNSTADTNTNANKSYCNQPNGNNISRNNHHQQQQ
jgi:hypothetical protein